MSLEYISVLDVNRPECRYFLWILRTLFDALCVHHVVVMRKRHGEFEFTTSLHVEGAHQVSLEIVFVVVLKPSFLFYYFLFEDHTFLYFGIQVESLHGFD